VRQRGTREPVPFRRTRSADDSNAVCGQRRPAGRPDGKFVTARHIRERLYKENSHQYFPCRSRTPTPRICFLVSGRGEMQIAVLVEQMRAKDTKCLSRARGDFEA